MTHFVHPQRQRHQQEYPSMVDGREDERSGHAFHTKFLQGIIVDRMGWSHDWRVLTMP